MITTIYVNWDTSVILNQSQYENFINKKVDELVNNTSEFNEWLDRCYLACEIYHMSEASRNEIFPRWVAYCREEVIYERNSDWEEVSIEV